MRRTRRRFSAALLAMAVAAATGCGLVPLAPGPASAPAPADRTRATDASEPDVYYTGEGSMALLAAPGFGSETVATLPLHQKVLRARTERGFAFVTVEETGQTGWVENAKLIWRLPEVPATPPVVRAPAPALVEVPAGATGSSPPEAPAAPAVPDLDAAEPTAAPPDPDQASPAVFDPF